jgi:hypothetical protein
LTKPFRLTPPDFSEQEMHEQVARLCEQLVAPPAAWACYPAGAVQLGPAQMAKLSRMGLQRGWPDFLFLHGGKLRGLELKAKGGALSKTKIVRTKRGSPRVLVGQVERFAELEAAGMTIAVARSVDEVLATLERWQIPLRGRAA